MSWLLTTIVSAVVAALVSWGFAYWQAGREEAGRQDRLARGEVARHLRALRVRLLQEAARRRARREGETMVRRPEFSIYECQDLVWPVLDALSNPVLNRRVAEQVEARLKTLMGERQVEYLKLLTAPPGRPASIRDVTERLKESRVLEQGLDTPIDRMLLSDDPASVEDVIAQIDEVMALVLR